MGAAGARELAAAAPAVGLAVAHASVRLALAMRVAGAALSAVRAPVLAWAACGGRRWGGWVGRERQNAVSELRARHGTLLHAFYKEEGIQAHPPRKPETLGTSGSLSS